MLVKLDELALGGRALDNRLPRPFSATPWLTRSSQLRPAGKAARNRLILEPPAPGTSNRTSVVSGFRCASKGSSTYRSRWCVWRNEFGGLKAQDAKRLKDLGRENAALPRKRLVGVPRAQSNARRHISVRSAREIFGE